MYKTKTLRLLQTFDNWEINHFRKFLLSPYFNSREDVRLLFEYLVEEKEKRNPRLTKADVFEQVFPNKNYDQENRDLLVSYLFKLIEKFLTYREIEADEAFLSLYLSKAYRRKKEEKLFKRALRIGKKTIEKSKLRDSKYIRQRFDLEFEEYAYIGSKMRSAENNLQELADTFDEMYIAEKLKQFCLQISHTAVFEKKYDDGLQQEIFQLLERNKNLLLNPAIDIYYLFYLVATTDNEEHYKELRSKIDLYIDYFTPEEMRDVNLLAINFCVKQMNRGKTEYMHEAFELFQLGLNNELWIENGELNRITFTNIAILGIKLKKFEWVEQFIEDYRNKLPLQFRDNYYKYQLANLRFEQNNYEDATELLAGFESSDNLMNLGAKWILLKIYYKKQAYDALDSLLESMRMNLQRNKKMGYHKTHYTKVIKLTKLLLRFNGRKKDKIRLREKAEEIQVSRTRDWFLSQIELL